MIYNNDTELLNKKELHKRIFTFLIGTIILLGIVSSLAYFTFFADNSKNNKVNLKTGDMALTFSDGDNGINAKLQFGETITKKFLIENTGSLTGLLNFEWANMTNTYGYESLSYNLEYCTEDCTTEDAVFNTLVEETNIPIAKNPITQILAQEISVPAKTTYYYNLNIKLNDLESTNQQQDIDAIFTTNFSIGEATKYRYYTLKVDPNGGVWNNFSNAQEYKLMYNETKNIIEPTKEGSNFQGWELTGVESKIENGTFTMGISNAILKAIWDTEKYNITININGEEQTAKLAIGESLNLEEPAIEGKTFTGWKVSGGTVKDNIFTLTENKNVTIEAMFQNQVYNYKVIHRQMNKEGTDFEIIDVETGSLEYGSTLRPNVLTYTGFSSPETQSKVIEIDEESPVKNVIIYDYTREKYSLIIDPNGGTYTEKTSFALFYDTSTPISIPTKDGYTFGGWEITSGKIENNIYTISNENAKITAKWLNNDYDYIIYHKKMNLDGLSYDTAETESGKAQYNTEIIPETKSYPGFTSPEQQSLTITSNNSNNTLDYLYTRNKYNLVINPNGGIYDNKESQTTKELFYEGSTTLESPTKKGYSFTGWTNDSGTITDMTFKLTDPSNAKITANWAINSYSYTVNHYQMNTDGETFTLTDSETNSAPFSSEVIPSTKNYIGFSSPEVKNITITENPENNTINYYYQRNKFNLTINPFGGTYNNSEETTTKEVYFGEQIDLGVAEKRGYNFSNWVKTTTSDAEINGNIITIGNDDVSIRASYIPKTLTITLNANGGILLNENKNVIYNETYGELPIPEYEGYEFLGWFTDKDDGEKIEEDTIVNVDTDQTLYAHWLYSTYTLTFDANGGFVDITSKNVVYGKPYGDLPEASKDSMSFAGWFTDAVDGTQVTSDTIVDRRENVTLYAHYTIAPGLDGSLSIIGETPKDGPTSFVNAVTTEADSGLFKLEDDYGPSYYFRGIPANNYVKFAGLYWRILRINGDGSLRLVYDGKTAFDNGAGSTARVAILDQPWNNAIVTDNKYVGYMYGGANGEASTSKAQAQINETNTNMKIQLEQWYRDNIKDLNLDNYVADGIFCNDRSTASTPKTWWTSESATPGFGNNYTAYGGLSRFKTTSNGWNTTNPKPTFKCQNQNDRFTKDDTVNGNGKLNEKIGLITVDEAVAAGSGINQNNVYYYLFRSTAFYTMTPLNFYFSRAYLFSVTSTGSLTNTSTDTSSGIVPVINLSKEYVVNLKGSGTKDDPFQYNSKEIKIELNANEGTVPVKAILRDTGASYGEIPNPSRSGYIFTGWYTDQTAGTKIENDTIITETTNHQIYAHWEPYIDNKATDILDKLGISANEGSPAFNKTATTAEGVYSMQDDYGLSYYYRGAVDNNYVLFGGFYWRIIRVNGDGTLRIIYDGTEAHANGEANVDRFAVTSKSYNTARTDNKYVGYMYSPGGTAQSFSREQAQTNEVSSNAKIELEKWYEDNINSQNLDKYVADSLFCNDRTLPGKDLTNFSTDTGRGYYAYQSAYGAYKRLYTNKTPQFICEQKNDRFTKEDVDIGNGNLSAKVGLITADEVSAAGGVFNSTNRNYYLYKGNTSYWTMSPYNYYYYSSSSTNGTFIYTVNSNGQLKNDTLNTGSYHIVPVLNLKYDYVSRFQGSGTSVDPYRPFSENEITIELDAGEIEISPTQIIAEVGKPYGTLPTPTKTGYTFGGWFTEPDGNGTQITEETEISISNNHTLYALMKPNNYTITLNGNGITSEPASKTVYYNSTYGDLPLLEREGYTFNGWYTSTSGGTKIEESTKVTITANQTLYARWTANTYTITYDANTGTCSSTSKTVTYGSTYSTLPTPTKTGYNFSGWFTEPTGGTKIISSTKVSIANDHTLYAQWELKSFTVTFNANGGTISGSTSNTVYWGQEYGYLPSASRSGYTFKGWYTSTSAGTEVKSDTIVSLTSNQTLYARWEGNNYTVTFDANHGSVDTESIIVTTGGTYGTLPTPTYEKGTFLGWYTAKVGGTKITNTTKVSVTSNHTLYAQWNITSGINISLSVLNINANTTAPDFTTFSTGSGGVYTMADDYGNSYYYRGNIVNNYVKFGKWSNSTPKEYCKKNGSDYTCNSYSSGGDEIVLDRAGKDMYWRIIRINGDGSLRMIYDGTQAYANDTFSVDRSTIYKQNFGYYINDAKYAGYMYAPSGAAASTSKSQAQTNTESSVMKSALETWYSENLLEYDTEIADKIFCNDRSIVGTTGGYGLEKTIFGGGQRLAYFDSTGYLAPASAPNPIFTCPQKNDAFTKSDTTKGNGKLSQKVGLITGDELLTAGIIFQNNRTSVQYNTDSYILKGIKSVSSGDFWTMTPMVSAYWSDNAVGIFQIGAYYNGMILAAPNMSSRVAPVINLTPAVVAQLYGTGTQSNPYHLN